MAAEGSLNLLEVCEEICGTQVDLSVWRSKIMEEMASKEDDTEVEVGEIVQVYQINLWQYFSLIHSCHIPEFKTGRELSSSGDTVPEWNVDYRLYRPA